MKFITRHMKKCVIPFLFLMLFPVLAGAQSYKTAMKAGKTALKENRFEAAIQSFTEAISLKADLADAYIFRADAYEKSARPLDAANDYRKASDLDQKDVELSLKAGRLYYQLHKYEDAIFVLNRAIKADKKLLDPYMVKFDCLMALSNHKEALLTIEQALAVKKTAPIYYYHGAVSERLSHYQVAEDSYRKAIKKDKKFKEAYLGLAHSLWKQGKSDDALEYCNSVLQQYPQYAEAFVMSSRIYYGKSDLINAISSISKALDLVQNADSLYFKRAGYYAEVKQHANAISDYSKVVSLNATHHMAFYNRAVIYEKEKQIPEATADYKSFLKLTEKRNDLAVLQKDAKQKIYDLNIESEKPEIALTSPVLKANGIIEVPKNVKTLVINATIKDKSTFESIKVNSEMMDFDKLLNHVDLVQEVSISGQEKITIQATDIYHNTFTVSYSLLRTEVDPPLVEVYTPYTSSYKEIFLENEKPEMYIVGKVIDESLIRKVTIAGVAGIFNTDDKNPSFSATIPVEGKNDILIEAEDIYGNKSVTKFKLNWENARILSTNPMGKTWVVFIDNSDYRSFATLDGPEKDILTMKAAFAKYDIHNIIEKKNMTKAQMEKFFAIELRDYVREQKVNSLLVWYAGHGKFINETGYWIPVDAQRDEEFSYFNVNALKAFMQSYATYMTHVLVVTDACESGPSFYAAMRGAKDRNCGDFSSTKFKSSQVFSSAGAELAADNSPFTKTFARSLEYNNDDCIAIDNIVTKVTAAVSTSQKQSPKFGKISGLDDEDGTFFFIKKSK